MINYIFFKIILLEKIKWNNGKFLIKKYICSFLVIFIFILIYSLEKKIVHSKSKYKISIPVNNY